MITIQILTTRKLLLKIGVFLLILFQSCYKLSDVYVNDFDPIYNTFEPVEFFDEQDTIYITESVELTFNLDSVSEFYGYEILLDNEIIQSEDRKNFRLYFRSRDYSDGFHTLTLNVYKASGTGSLAEKLGFEALMLSVSKVLFLGNNYEVPKPVVTGFDVIDGELYMNIEPYPGYGFTNLQVSFELIDIEEIVITDPNQTVIPIPDYAGQRIYIGLTYTALGNRYGYIGFGYTYDANYNLEIVGGKVILSWENLPFNSCGGVNVEVDDTYDTQAITFTALKDDGKLEFQLNDDFPFRYELKTFILDKEGNSYNLRDVGGFARSRVIESGIMFQPFQIIDADHLIIYRTTGSAFVTTGFFNADLCEIVDRANEGEDSLHVIKTVNSVIFSESYGNLYQVTGVHTVNKLDSKSLDVVETIDLGDFINDITSIEMLYPADNNLLGIHYNSRFIAVFDWQNKVVLNTIIEDCNYTKDYLYTLSLSASNLIGSSFSRGLSPSYIDITKESENEARCLRAITKLLNSDIEIYFDANLDSYFTRTENYLSFTQYNIEPFEVEPYIRGNLMYSYGEDSVLRVYDLNTQEIIKTFNISRHGSKTALTNDLPYYVDDLFGFKLGGLLFTKQF
ncbi:MAG: hypothetical protein KDC79_03545 [Cyclobacteriaceae bacterium]|nr:hypothetical protein [Cyclobacteriaceae bacterium]